MAVDCSTKTLGCSGCLIEAIERGDETTLRQLLPAPNVEFHDSYWISRSSLSVLEAPNPERCKCFPVVSAASETAPRCPQPENCSHSIFERNLLPDVKKRLKHIAMSVVLSAMQHTTRHFNALQILVESQKFDMSEPVIFHWKGSKFAKSRGLWNVVAVWRFCSTEARALTAALT